MQSCLTERVLVVLVLLFVSAETAVGACLESEYENEGLQLMQMKGAKMLASNATHKSGHHAALTEKDAKDDAAPQLSPCYENAIKSAYAIHPLPILKRLSRVEAFMREGGCLKELDGMIPPAPLPQGQTPLAPIGPPKFLEHLWTRREQSPKLLQMQPVGISVDPERVLALMDICSKHENKTIMHGGLHDKFEAEDDAVYYRDLQHWTFCEIFRKDEDTRDQDFSTLDSMDFDKKELGKVLQPLLDAGLLSSIQFSVVEPQTLVEWHADSVFDLINSDGLECSKNASDAFESLDNPWKVGDLETVRFHIPLSNQDNTHFFTSGSALSMKAGEMIALDYYQPHSLYNSGTKPRVNLLMDFDAMALNSEPTMRKLLSSAIGQQMLATILRLGYHDKEITQARTDLETLLYEYQREQCHGRTTGALGHKDDYRRLLQERKWAGLSHEVTERSSKHKRKARQHRKPVHTRH